MSIRAVAAVVLVAIFTRGVHAQAKPNRIWKSSPDGVEILAATFLGGSGTEWLASGGFLPDGNIVLVGNVLGPTFDIPGKVGVIGTDLPPPAEPRPIPVLNKGKPKIVDGNPVHEKPSWRHDGVTAFVAIYSGDLRKLIALQRLPWTAGAATAAAVGPDGAIYVVGRATDNITRLGGNVAELSAMPAIARPDPRAVRCDHAFIARVSADGSKALWVRHVRGPSAAPTVDVTVDGKVRFGAGHVHVLDTAGKLLSTVVIPGGLRTTSSVRPEGGQIVVGGEHHWPTGREPWRCPTLNIHNPDGTLKHQFYDWGGPYVGLDNCRQVSDTAVRYVTHDRDGSVLMYLWSDGGNSVATTQPFDVREPVGLRGLGMTTAGAGVLSAAYLIRLDPKDYRVTAWTLWLANNSAGKPVSIWIEQLARTSDGSLAFAGKSAWGVWQTRDRLAEAEPEGEYLAVLSEDFTGLRYSSVIPGAGAADLNDGAATRGSGWGIATGTMKGKSRVLFLAGATAGRKDGDKFVPTPTRNAAQEKFGGGRADGYVVLMELAQPTVPTRAEAKLLLAGPTRASFERSVTGKSARGTARLPEKNTTFHFLASHPKWVTVDAEIRDQAGKFRPGFMYGKPVEGLLKFTGAGLEGKITVACTAICQPHGEPQGRILGSLLQNPGKPQPLAFALESLGPVHTHDVKFIDQGVEKTRQVKYHLGKGALTVGGTTVAVAPKVTVSYAGPKDGPLTTVRLNAYVTLPAAQLGLRGPAPDEHIDVRIGISGTNQTGPVPKK